jgi:hypothetical protein
VAKRHCFAASIGFSPAAAAGQPARRSPTFQTLRREFGGGRGKPAFCPSAPDGQVVLESAGVEFIAENGDGQASSCGSILIKGDKLWKAPPCYQSYACQNKIDPDCYLSTRTSMRVDPHIYLSRPEDLDLTSEPLKAALEQLASTATRIDILSAYYGTDYLGDLLSQAPTSIRKRCRLRLIFGVTTYSGLAAASEALAKFRKHLVSLGYRNPEIRLFTKSLFHTKLYLFVSGTWPTWFVGSANASGAISGDRHELMIQMRGRHDALSRYIDAVAEVAIPVGGRIDIPAGASRDMRSFFLKGSLCYRPTYRPSLAFDACQITAVHRRFLGQLLADSAGVAHANPKTEGFAFSLVSVSRSQAPDPGSDRAHQNPISNAGGAHRGPKRLAMLSHLENRRAKASSIARRANDMHQIINTFGWIYLRSAGPLCGSHERVGTARGQPAFARARLSWLSPCHPRKFYDRTKKRLTQDEVERVSRSRRREVLKLRQHAE